MIVSELTPFITHDPARERFHSPLGAVCTLAPVRLAFSDGRAAVKSAELVLSGDDGFEERYEMSPEGATGSLPSPRRSSPPRCGTASG